MTLDELYNTLTTLRALNGTMSLLIILPKLVICARPCARVMATAVFVKKIVRVAKTKHAETFRSLT
jgi:hypothetical protein